MAFIETLNGALNLDKVVQIVCQTNGDAYFYVDNNAYVTVNLGADHTTAVAAVRKLTQAFDASRLA